MRTLSPISALVAIALACSALTTQPRLAAQSTNGDRYANGADSPESLRGLASDPSASSAMPRQLNPAEQDPAPGGALGNGAAFSAAQPFAPEEIPPQVSPHSSSTTLDQSRGIDDTTVPPHIPRESDTRLTPRPTTSKEWVSRLLTRPEEDELVGMPLTLDEAMQGSVGTRRQSEVVTAYWRLATAVAKYHAARFSTTTSPRETDVDAIRAKLEAFRAQHRLALVLGWPQGELPLPVSEPHVGSYNTRYDEIFAGQFSRGAWELDRSLPLMYQLVKACADNLSRQRPGTTEFRTGANEFLDAVRQYNLAIAEYALLAAGDSLSGRELVPLLIRVDRSDGQIARSSAQSQNRRRMAAVPSADVSPSRPGSDDELGGQLDLQQHAPVGQWRQRQSASRDIR